MKPVYTIRVTAVEAFRQFLYGQTEDNEAWVNEPNVINTVKGIESTNVKADYGTAGHSIIENPFIYKTDAGYKVDKFIFTDTQVSPLMQFRAEHPLMTREIPLAKLYSTPSFDLIVTGTCDHLEGNWVRDTKFKFSSFDVADFMDSIQWRLYLDMLGLNHFVYDFFKVTGFDSLADCQKSKIGKCESMPVNSYPDMQKDIGSILTDFAEWITFKGLEEYLVINKQKARKIIAGDYRLKQYMITKKLIA